MRCALTIDQREAALDALKVLNRDYPHDSRVMYLSTHAYSDLSMRASQDLAQFAPSSLEAHQMSAEALELQGKWDDAAKEYGGFCSRIQICRESTSVWDESFFPSRTPVHPRRKIARQQFEAELKLILLTLAQSMCLVSSLVKIASGKSQNRIFHEQRN